MKLNNITIKLAAVGLVAGLALPVIASAQLGSPAREPRQNGNQGQQVANGGGFCNSLENANGNRMKERREQQKSNVNEKRAERKGTLEMKREQRSGELEMKRLAADERRSEIIDNLSDLAGNEVQEEALVKFQEAVRTAVEARRDAFDVANETFRTGLSQAIVDRQEAIDVIIETYRLKVDAAEAQAKVSCGVEDVDQNQVRTDLLAAVKAAKDEMKAAIQDINNVGQAIKSLQDIRKEAMETAKTAFLAAMEQARTDLKSVLEDEEEDEIE